MKKKPDFKVIAALITVAVVWGTTYLAIRVAVQSIPPWFVTVIRQSLASLILMAFLLYNRQLKWIGWKALRQQLLLSALMVVIANGMTTVAEQSIPSGLTSLLGALSIRLQKPSWKGFIGVLMGFLGVVFIFRDGIGGLLNPDYRNGIIAMSIALAGWVAGTIYTKKNTAQGANIFLLIFYQLAFASIAQLGLAFIFSPVVDPSAWKFTSIAAACYLGVFGSIVGYFSYVYALKKVSATEVSITSYFNTIIALFLGWLILDEVISYELLIATILIISGVFITSYKKTVVAITPVPEAKGD
jgi:drug/metabolite transporter (DMT)-like permease